MKSAARGKSISEVEVTHISRSGIWLLAGDREWFLAFELFPWFRSATIGEIHNVEWPQPHRFHWPDLDVDIAVESIEHPERFPLVSRARPPKRRVRTSNAPKSRSARPRAHVSAPASGPRATRRS